MVVSAQAGSAAGKCIDAIAHVGFDLRDPLSP
jgi:hypothetical protein